VSEVEREESRRERQTGKEEEGCTGARRAAKETKNKRLRVVHYPRLMGRGYWWSNKRNKGKRRPRESSGGSDGLAVPKRKTKGMVVITSVRMESEWWASRLLWVPRR